MFKTDIIFITKIYMSCGQLWNDKIRNRPHTIYTNCVYMHVHTCSCYDDLYLLCVDSICVRFIFFS